MGITTRRLSSEQRRDGHSIIVGRSVDQWSAVPKPPPSTMTKGESRCVPFPFQYLVVRINEPTLWLKKSINAAIAVSSLLSRRLAPPAVPPRRRAFITER
ncbi:unnamed protein product [Soboliphyme baturini]|uniref:Uncharacterized protein n=1 Tax=Soboliphyme baturini TaxID=241478 RepID=A0A183IVZ5_9BILA|nr:unnamed protein product [Soboliphyme baturini]